VLASEKGPSSLAQEVYFGGDPEQPYNAFSQNCLYKHWKGRDFINITIVFA